MKLLDPIGHTLKPLDDHRPAAFSFDHDGWTLVESDAGGLFAARFATGESCLLEDADPVLQSLAESIYDQHILKAVFIAGAGGSGKSSVSDVMFAGTGMKVINQDRHLERFLKMAKVPLDKVGTRYDLFRKARDLKGKELDQYAGRRLGLIIDSTGWDYDRIADPAKKLEKIGYDTYMVFVTTSLDTALNRNKKRGEQGGRDVPDAYVKDAHRGAHRNVGRYKNLFGQRNFFLIDNDKDMDPASWQSDVGAKARRIARRILDAPLRNPKGKQWIAEPEKHDDPKQQTKKAVTPVPKLPTPKPLDPSPKTTDGPKGRGWSMKPKGKDITPKPDGVSNRQKYGKAKKKTKQEAMDEAFAQGLLVNPSMAKLKAMGRKAMRTSHGEVRGLLLPDEHYYWEGETALHDEFARKTQGKGVAELAREIGYSPVARIYFFDNGGVEVETDEKPRGPLQNLVQWAERQQVRESVDTMSTSQTPAYYPSQGGGFPPVRVVECLLNEGSVDAPADSKAAKELLKAATTNPALKKMYLQAVVRPVRLWSIKGSYNREKAPKLAQHLVVFAGRLLGKGSANWHERYNPKTRAAAMVLIRNQAEKDAKAGVVDATLPKKWNPRFQGYDKPLKESGDADAPKTGANAVHVRVSGPDGVRDALKGLAHLPAFADTTNLLIGESRRPPKANLADVAGVVEIFAPRAIFEIAKPVIGAVPVDVVDIAALRRTEESSRNEAVRVMRSLLAILTEGDVGVSTFGVNRDAQTPPGVKAADAPEARYFVTAFVPSDRFPDFVHGVVSENTTKVFHNLNAVSGDSKLDEGRLDPGDPFYQSLPDKMRDFVDTMLGRNQPPLGPQPPFTNEALQAVREAPFNTLYAYQTGKVAERLGIERDTLREALKWLTRAGKLRLREDDIEHDWYYEIKESCHHEKVTFKECGHTQTCRCSAPKVVEERDGLCPDCRHGGVTEDDKGEPVQGPTYMMTTGELKRIGQEWLASLPAEEREAYEQAHRHKMDRLYVCAEGIEQDRENADVFHWALKLDIGQAVEADVPETIRTRVAALRDIT